MKHIQTITSTIPAKAESPAEIAGAFQKLSIMASAGTAALGSLTAGVNFWNLISNPPNEIANGQKGVS